MTEYNRKKYDDVNMTDAVLFTSVMKHKKACQIVLSILFQKNEEDIQLEEVFVEDDIPNEKGQRAIRLDVCVREVEKESGHTIYDLEMQGQINDDIPRRSRYYQSLMDAPLLKSGKETKYRNLPDTYVIFIMEQDIFGLDRTQYTFSNYCKEHKELALGDGSAKIFLNMESGNGNKELVDLLQYMKDAAFLEGKELEIDKRILGLDKLVAEVKESVEWEDKYMTIMEKGKKIGEEIGKEIGKEIGSEERLISLVLAKYKKGLLIATIAEHLEATEEEVMAIVHTIKQYPGASVEELTNEYRKMRKD